MNKYIKKDMEIFKIKDSRKIKYFRNLFDNMLKKYKYVCVTENYYDDDSILDRNKRLEFNNWQELVVDGNWGWTNKGVKNYVCCLLKLLKKRNMLNDVYIGKCGYKICKNEEIIYIYNRESKDRCDYIILFSNKELF